MYIAVINPLFPTVVYWMPICCRFDAIHSRTPQMMPPGSACFQEADFSSEVRPVFCARIKINGSSTIPPISERAAVKVKGCRIRSKDAEYAAKEKELQQQYEEETERSTEIDDLETYMKSSQYIEDVAKSKLGLTYKNEIIFKEKK